jgi:CDP-2,3-bis-(O-geranylgeranyl)-sn-glycerol synthase
VSVEPALPVLLLLVLVNGTPIVARWALGARLDFPVDRGLRLADGRRLLGPDKTWRGLASGVLAAALVAPVLGWAPGIAALFAAASLLGDLATSFLKRRLGIAPGRSVAVLDQGLESALPLLLLGDALALQWVDALGVVAVFTLLDLALSPLRRLLRRWPPRWRRRP